VLRSKTFLGSYTASVIASAGLGSTEAPPSLRVLLVEDNPADADLVREALAEAGAEATLVCVERISEALARAGDGKWDVVLLDLSLPDAHELTGLEQLLRAFPDLAIVVLTSLEDDRLATRAVAAGAQDYLLKSQLQPSLLVRSLRYAIEREHHAARARALADARAARLAAATAQGTPLLRSCPTEPLRVLLVEDNPADADLVRDALAHGRAGTTLVCVERIEDALERAREGDWDVVLLDLSLPDAQDLSGAHRLRLACPQLPIIVLTSLEDDRVAAAAVAEGAQDYLLKGHIESSLLVRSIRYAIERQHYADRARLLAEERASRIAAEAAQRRALLLSEVSGALTTTLDDEATLRSVARVLVREFADWCAIELGDDASTRRLTATAHVDRTKEDLLRRWRERGPAAEPAGPSAASVVRTGRSELHADVAEASLAGWARDADGLELLREVGLRSAMVVPVSVRGRIFGAMTLATVGFRRYGPEDLALADEIARRLATALDNSRLHREGQQMLAALRASESRFRAVLDQVQDYAIFVLDRDGRVASWSVGAHMLKGWAHEEIVGRHFEAFFPPEDVASGKPAAELECAAREGHFREEGWRLRKDGSRFLAEVVLTALRDERGDVFGFVKVTRDVTERKRLFEETQRAIRVREDVLAVVSHDLKSPLQAIHLAAQNAARIVAQCSAQCTVRRPLETIQRAARSANVLLQDLLDMASIRAGRLAIRTATEDTESLIADAVQAHEAVAREKGISLASRGATTAPVLCDRDRVQQVFSNVIANAVRVCGPGDRVDLAACADDRFATFTVADSGPGIAEDVLPLVFEAYWSSAKQRNHGTGLGLFISKGIVEAHGGRMWVESRVGEGTKVRFTLPVASASR
jgi:PAS domain S-box-containing protein